MRWIRIMIVVEAVCVTALILVWAGRKSEKEEKYLYTTGVVNEEQQITWVELLAYLGAKYGGDFKGNSKCLEKDMNGLKAYFSIAKGFEYTHYDDFGSGRSYGYKRKHLGHDMMGQTGTPVVAEKRNK